MTIERLRGDAGIGMTELAVAIVVLGVILVGLFPLVVNSIGLAQGNSEVGQANRIVLTNVNQSRVQPLSSTCPFVGTVDMPLFENPAPTMFGGAVRLSCTAGDPAGLTTVQVDVWRLSDTSSTISTATTKVRA